RLVHRGIGVERRRDRVPHECGARRRARPAREPGVSRGPFVPITPARRSSRSTRPSRRGAYSAKETLVNTQETLNPFHSDVTDSQSTSTDTFNSPSPDEIQELERQ